MRRALSFQAVVDNKGANNDNMDDVTTTIEKIIIRKHTCILCRASPFKVNSCGGVCGLMKVRLYTKFGSSIDQIAVLKKCLHYGLF